MLNKKEFAEDIKDATTYLLQAYEDEPCNNTTLNYIRKTFTVVLGMIMKKHGIEEPEPEFEIVPIDEWPRVKFTFSGKLAELLKAA